MNKEVHTQFYKKFKDVHGFIPFVRKSLAMHIKERLHHFVSNEVVSFHCSDQTLSAPYAGGKLHT